MSLDELSALLWAKRPKSQQAIDLLKAGAAEGDKRMAEILAGHIKDGVCDEHGRLLRVWSGGQWVKPDWYARVNYERSA